MQYLDTPLHAIQTPTITDTGSNHNVSVAPGGIYALNATAADHPYKLVSNGASAGYSGMAELFITLGSGASIVLDSSLSYYDVAITESCHVVIQWQGTSGTVYVI